MRDFRARPGFCRYLFACLTLLILSGCGDGKLTTYPVTGKVLADGQPAEGAVVTFIPVGGSEEFLYERPIGLVDAEGKFDLKTFVKGDGAAAGDYKVTVRWKRDSNPAQFDYFGGRYMTPDKTPLTAKIESGPNELPPFELSSK